MINSTISLTILSIQETHDKHGVKIAYGDCSFPSYSSKDCLVENTVPFRAKGSAAVTIASLGSQAKGVATGYPDLEVIDNSNGYKEKRCVLVIRNFIPTTTSLTENYQTQPTAEPAMSVVATTTNQESTVDVSEIPF